MSFRCLAWVLFLFLALSASVFAQDENIQPSVDYQVNKMKRELNLTDSQAYAIGPIVKEYLIKRKAVLDQAAGEGVVDHVAIKGTLRGLKDQEHQRLSKILTEDQMKKWINKEILMATLNPDSAESTVDDGATLYPSGVNVKF